jgi:hypothetical protein
MARLGLMKLSSEWQLGSVLGVLCVLLMLVLFPVQPLFVSCTYLNRVRLHCWGW